MSLEHTATWSWCRGSSSVQILRVEVNCRPCEIWRLVMCTGKLEVSSSLVAHHNMRRKTLLIWFLKGALTLSVIEGIQQL